MRSEELGKLIQGQKRSNQLKLSRITISEFSDVYIKDKRALWEFTSADRLRNCVTTLPTI
jgi:hypothetical protein